MNRARHSSLQLIELVVGAWAAAAPAADHPVGRRFRQLVAEQLAGESIVTLGPLVAWLRRQHEPRDEG